MLAGRCHPLAPRRRRRILNLIDDHSRLAIASVDTHHRVRTDRVDDTGSITLRLAGIADPKAKSRASPATASDELSRGGSKLDCGPQLAPELDRWICVAEVLRQFESTSAAGGGDLLNHSVASNFSSKFRSSSAYSKVPLVTKSRPAEVHSSNCE